MRHEDSLEVHYAIIKFCVNELAKKVLLKNEIFQTDNPLLSKEDIIDFHWVTANQMVNKEYFVEVLRELIAREENTCTSSQLHPGNHLYDRVGVEIDFPPTTTATKTTTTTSSYSLDLEHFDFRFSPIWRRR